MHLFKAYNLQMVNKCIQKFALCALAFIKYTSVQENIFFQIPDASSLTG